MYKMPRKSYDFDKMIAYDFSNINMDTNNTSSDNCYGSCNTSCDIDCDCVCDSDWGWGSFEREARKEREMALAREKAREREYSKKKSKDKTEKTIGDELDSMSEEELLNIIQRATQALVAKQKASSH